MYASLDLHKRYSEAVVMDEDGVVLREERIENDPRVVEEFSNSLPNATDVVTESSSAWYWVYQILVKKHRVVLSNQVKTKVIASAKVKSDHIDALTLANFLRGGYIAECYIPPKHIMELRDLVRYRANLVRMRSNIKNRIHAYLLMNNIKIETTSFSRQFLEEVRKIDDMRVQGYFRIIDSINDEIREASSLICSEAMNNEQARLLMTMPGISFYSALLIVSEIGDVNRFPDSYHLVAYAGLAPSTHSPGGRTYHGRITKMGSPHSLKMDTEPMCEI
jgi:transposase